MLCKESLKLHMQICMFELRVSAGGLGRGHGSPGKHWKEAKIRGRQLWSGIRNVMSTLSIKKQSKSLHSTCYTAAMNSILLRYR